MLTACENTCVEWLLMGLVFLKAGGWEMLGVLGNVQLIKQTSQLNNQN